MRSLYLIFAVAALLVTCETQQRNNDIIWYPVEDEEGVFISTLGEKYRSSSESKWRSHRRARYSGIEIPLPLSYDPTENEDPSFFHNINERRPLLSSKTIPKIPPSFQIQQLPLSRPNERPQGQGNQNFNENAFQEILNEVFDYNKYPPVSEFSGNRPGTTNQWGNRPTTQNQWGNEMQRPEMENQSGTTGSLINGNIEHRPGISNQWGGTSSRPFERPTPDNRPSNRPTSSSRPNRPTSSSRPNRPTSSSRPNRPTSSSRPNRPTSQSDKLIFPDEASSSATTTPSNLNPTDPPTMSPCERLCPVTPEFNPVCGSDSKTYTNAGRLKCAQKCGTNVELAHYGNCGRTSLVTPLVSSSRRQKSKGFWFLDK